MNRVEGEDCPVCWRTYSQDLVPVALACGHSLCNQCSAELNRCPLCRKRLLAGAVRPTNYSLLSLLNRLNESERAVETKDVEMQTEKPQRLKRPIIPRGVEVITPGVALEVVVKLSRIQQQLLRLFKSSSNPQPN